MLQTLRFHSGMAIYLVEHDFTVTVVSFLRPISRVSQSEQFLLGLTEAFYGYLRHHSMLRYRQRHISRLQRRRPRVGRRRRETGTEQRLRQTTKPTATRLGDDFVVFNSGRGRFLSVIHYYYSVNKHYHCLM